MYVGFPHSILQGTEFPISRLLVSLCCILAFFRSISRFMTECDLLFIVFPIIMFLISRILCLSNLIG